MISDTRNRDFNGECGERPKDNRASRSLYQRLSSQVGDHWRIPAVVCFLLLSYSLFLLTHKGQVKVRAKNKVQVPFVLCMGQHYCTRHDYPVGGE